MSSLATVPVEPVSQIRATPVWPFILYGFIYCFIGVPAERRFEKYLSLLVGATEAHLR